VGSIATFYCRVTGDPTPTVNWRKNGKKLTSVHSRIQIQNFAGVSMLRIEPIRHQRDESVYDCYAENGVGDPVTSSANLTVFAGKSKTNSTESANFCIGNQKGRQKVESRSVDFDKVLKC
jgi:hypothetical protein